MINLAPWFYRSLLEKNQIIEIPEFFQVCLLNGNNLFEVICTLNPKLRPDWVSSSQIYNNCDGAGASKHKNIAAYKAISEALERWAFYVAADVDEKKFCFDVNPTTTGMAAYPGISCSFSRKYAQLEANERWALHEFWRGNLPVKEHFSHIQNLRHFEILTPFENCYISVLMYKADDKFLFAFAAENSLAAGLQHSLVELDRNLRVLKKINVSTVNDFEDISDKRLFYFSTQEGADLFLEKIISSPKSICSKPRLICDSEIIGEWTKYTKVWRFLYADSFPDSNLDYKIFMF